MRISRTWSVFSSMPDVWCYESFCSQGLTTVSDPEVDTQYVSHQSMNDIIDNKTNLFRVPASPALLLYQVCPLLFGSTVFSLHFSALWLVQWGAVMETGRGQSGVKGCVLLFSLPLHREEGSSPPPPNILALSLFPSLRENILVTFLIAVAKYPTRNNFRAVI